MVVFALYNGLVLLPVILSLIGPKKAEMKNEFELKEGKNFSNGHLNNQKQDQALEMEALNA